MDYIEQLSDDLVIMSRLALAGRPQDVQRFVQRLARRYRTSIPAMAEPLRALLQEMPTRQSPVRRDVQAPLPVDTESRLQLLRVEQHPTLDVEPIWDAAVETSLRQVLSERRRINELIAQGLAPTRSMIFTGPPGVGKSLAARWVARELDRPLLTLDLSAVMSSFLGRTGANVRYVLDYAKEVHCVLLLDELDAIAKRRDDATDVGELKRLVTVLLQEIDDWPSTGLLVAATNHSDLLDPAVWRRFELKVAFPMPTEDAIREAVCTFLSSTETPPRWCDILALLFRDSSFSDIERVVSLTRRSAVVNGHTIEHAITLLVRDHIKHLSRKDRGQLALWLTETGLSQRQVHELTGVSRDTIRKKAKGANK